MSGIFDIDHSIAVQSGARSSSTTGREPPMKEIIVLATLAFAVAAGAVTMVTVHPHWAMMACGNPNC